MLGLHTGRWMTTSSLHQLIFLSSLAMTRAKRWNVHLINASMKHDEKDFHQKSSGDLEKFWKITWAYLVSSLEPVLRSGLLHKICNVNQVLNKCAQLNSDMLPCNRSLLRTRSEIYRRFGQSIAIQMRSGRAQPWLSPNPARTSYGSQWTWAD